MRELGNYVLTKTFPKISIDVPREHLLSASLVESISHEPIIVHFEDSVSDALRILVSRVASEVHLVDADNVLMGAIRLEDLFSILKKEGLKKKL
jgi:hypothetical protein